MQLWFSIFDFREAFFKRFDIWYGHESTYGPGKITGNFGDSVYIDTIFIHERPVRSLKFHLNAEYR